MTLEPSLVALVEGEVPLSWVDNLSSRIDPCLRGVGFDQRLRKAMNGRADKFVERFPCSRKILALQRRNVFRERTIEVRRNRSGRQFIHESLDANTQFAGRKFSEGDCGNVFGVHALREQDCNPTSQNGCLSGSGTSLDQERFVDTGER